MNTTATAGIVAIAICAICAALALYVMSLVGRMIHRADVEEGTTDPDPTPQGDELVTDPWDSESYSLWPAPKHPPTDKDF